MKYQKLVDSLTQLINDEGLKGSDQLPTVAELMAKFDVSKSTVVKSLKVLEGRGVIYQRRGSGIFIREKHQRQNYLPFFHQIGQSHNLPSLEIERKVVKITIIKANENVAFNLKIDVGEGVYLLQRASFQKGQPLVFEESYFKLDAIPHFSEEVAAGSIFGYLRDKLKLKFGFTDAFLNLSRPPLHIAEFLNLSSPDQSVFHFEDIHHLSDGSPIFYVNLYYQPDKSRFYIYGNLIEP